MATELSEQIIESVTAKEWSRALRLVADARRESASDGKRYCTQPEYTGAWVKFRDKGYPFSLRKEYDEASLTDREAVAIVLRFVEAWEIPTLDGGLAELPNGSTPRTADILDGVDEIVAVWLVREFGAHRRDLVRPRKN